MDKIIAKTTGKTSQIDSSIFKAYDIRGTYPHQINEYVAYRLGRAFVVFLKCKQVVIGRDMRLSSPSLHDALIMGITDQGADVVDVGICSTPMLYFSIADYDNESGIMITASHNPKEYNGFKLCRRKAGSISGYSGIEEIKKIMLENKFDDSKDRRSKGKVTKKDILDDYVAKTLGISKAAKGIKKLKIVVDSGNGMGAKASAVIFDKLGLKPKMLFSEQDGSFPNHTPNPLNEENLIELKKTIKKEKADIGIAFDGDADRVGFVDENGLTVPNDLITALVAKELLKGKQGKKEKILFEIRSSWAVRDEIKRCGGIPLLWKAGHALIKEKMKEDDVLFGGEKSGHYFFRDFWYADCADIAALHVLKLMSDTGKKISELVAPLRIYFNPGEINFKLNDKDDAMEAVEKEFSSGKIMHLDGLTIEFNDWWFNLRKSNTEPYLRLNIEAKTEERMEEMKEKLTNIIKQFR